MAFKLKSKLTSGGLMGHSASKPKLNNSSKTGTTPLLQVAECLKYGTDPNTGEQICVTQKLGKDKGPTVKMDVGYENWLKKGNTGTMADFEAKAAEYWNKKGKNAIIQDRSTTDATSGTKTTSYTYEGTPRNIDPRWGKHYGFQEFTSETPTWREQQDKLKGSKLYRNFSDKKKKKVMDAYKKSFLIMNPDARLTKGPSSTVRTPNTSKTGGEAGKISDWKTRKN